jgi:hypothetical protein
MQLQEIVEKYGFYKSVWDGYYDHEVYGESVLTIDKKNDLFYVFSAPNDSCQSDVEVIKCEEDVKKLLSDWKSSYII